MNAESEELPSVTIFEILLKLVGDDLMNDIRILFDKCVTKGEILKTWNTVGIILLKEIPQT